jgi:hypothetical protein
MLSSSRIPRLPIVVGLCLAAAGCTDGASDPVGPVPDAKLGSSVAFNPQPEPPADIFTFTVQGQLDGDWRGRFSGPDGDGTVSIVTGSSRMAGQTLHLRQTWEFHPPEPGLAFGAELSGVVNLESGLLVLNGTGDGGPVHVHGEATSAGGGGFNIGGSVMFNPQPEPPAR